MEPVKIGINGLGRIGKLVFRLLEDVKEVEVVHINDKMNDEVLVHLLKHDTVHGRFNADISFTKRGINVNGRDILISHERHPTHIPWSLSKAEIVIESSGQFTTMPLLQKHISNGVRKVILTCPATDSLIDKTVIMGINHQQLTPDDKVISNASCTSNCVAMMLKVLHDNYGIKRAFMNTVHPFTNNQSLLDGPHNDFRRARAAVGNIIPTTTSAIQTVPLVMPEMRGIFDGFATRVPVIDGSFVELVAELDSDVNPRMVNDVFLIASNDNLKNYLEYCPEPLVSSDVINNTNSAVFDPLCTKVILGNMVQVLAWYDNEFGYANRVVDLLKHVLELEGNNSNV